MSPALAVGFLTTGSPGALEKRVLGRRKWLSELSAAKRTSKIRTEIEFNGEPHRGACWNAQCGVRPPLWKPPSARGADAAGSKPGFETHWARGR